MEKSKRDIEELKRVNATFRRQLKQQSDQNMESGTFTGRNRDENSCFNS